MLPQSILHLKNGLRELIFPSTCAGCGLVAPGNTEHFCGDCSHALTNDPHHACPRCSSSVGEYTDLEQGCPRCRDERYRFERSFRLGTYEGLLRDVVLRMKNASGETLAECMGRLWAKAAETRFREVKADVVIPIPLHWWRKWQRGYNQCEALADAIAQRLQLLHAPHWLKRVRHTSHQTSLTAASRRDNMKKAFRTSRRARVKDKCVLLVDDVLTTGTTASEAARALMEAGAARVVVAVLANR